MLENPCLNATRKERYFIGQVRDGLNNDVACYVWFLFTPPTATTSIC